MRKYLFSLLIPVTLIILIVLLVFFNDLAVASPPEVSAATAVVIDGETGQVLYDKHMHIQRYPASITKILTAIAALEEGNPDDLVTVSRNAAYQEGSSIYLEEGEKIPLKDLLYGILLASGNDAAVAIAEHIAGSVAEFAELMNEKAQKMGAQNSNFLNPSGLPETGHYSTAYDLAVIMRYALQNETFAEITATRHKTISWAGKDWGRGLRNHNKLLWSHPDATGGKTGYTRAAGRCLVSSAARDGREVVAVVLNSPNDWHDNTRLMDYGLDNFKKVIAITNGEVLSTLPWEQALEKELQIVTTEPVAVVVPVGGQTVIRKIIDLNSNLTLPVSKGQQIGKLTIYESDILIKETELVAASNLTFNSLFMRYWYKMTQLLKKSE